MNETMNIVLLLILILVLIKISLCNSLNAYVHIGPHKTGSTEVQKHILKNVDTFKQFNITTIGFISLAKGMSVFVKDYLQKSQDHYDTWIDDRIRDIKNSKNDILISSETLDFLNKTEVMKLKELLNGYNVTIIATHRACLSHIHSYWAQVSIGKQYFNDYLISTFQTYGTKKSNNGKDFKFLLETYAEVFGSNLIKVISFEGAILKYNYHPSSIFYALLEEIFHLPITSFNILGKSSSRNYFQLEMEIMINKFNNLRGCVNTELIRATIGEYTPKLPKSTIQIYPPIQFINDDLSIKKDYTYYLAPPINVYSDPLEYEVLCLECLNNDTIAMKTWTELLNKVSSCPLGAAVTVTSVTVTFLSRLFTAFIIIILIASLSLIIFDKKIKDNMNERIDI